MSLAQLAGGGAVKQVLTALLPILSLQTTMLASGSPLNASFCTQ